MKTMSAALVVLVMSLAAANGQDQRKGSGSNDPAVAPNIADQLRGDVGRQEQNSDIDKQIERTWQIVEEVRQNAQSLRLAHARLKDALENRDCVVAQRVLQMIEQSQVRVSRLGANLAQQCDGVDGRAQRQLSQACETERQALQGELTALKQQQQSAVGMCPALRN